MNFDSDMDDTLRRGGLNTSATPSIALLNQKLGTSPAPRMLEQSEIDLLRKSKEEVFKVGRGDIERVAPVTKLLLYPEGRSVLNLSRPYIQSGQEFGDLIAHSHEPVFIFPDNARKIIPDPVRKDIDITGYCPSYNMAVIECQIRLGYRSSDSILNSFSEAETDETTLERQ